MLPPLDYWTEDTLEQIRTLPELARLEMKAAEALSPVKGGSRDADTILAREVCAFANSSGGFLVYGFRDPMPSIPAEFDEGVAATIGDEPSKAWVEKKIPNLLFPKFHRCEAKHIRVAGVHASDRGVLVIEIPVSEHRPHWIIERNREIAYIRAGEHALPMSLQTFQDVTTRRGATAGEIIRLREGKAGAVLMRFRPDQHVCAHFDLNPQVQLTTGVICDRWAFELASNSAVGIYPSREGNTSRVEIGQEMRDGWALFGSTALFLHRPTNVCPSANRIIVNVPIEEFDSAIIEAVLYLEGAVPTRKSFPIRELIDRPTGDPVQG